MLGMKVKAIWGAMFPTSTGIITKVQIGFDKCEATIEWEDKSVKVTKINICDIKPAGSGNAVGIYFEREA